MFGGGGCRCVRVQKCLSVHSHHHHHLAHNSLSLRLPCHILVQLITVGGKSTGLITLMLVGHWVGCILAGRFFRRHRRLEFTKNLLFVVCVCVAWKHTNAYIRINRYDIRLTLTLSDTHIFVHPQTSNQPTNFTCIFTNAQRRSIVWRRFWCFVAPLWRNNGYWWVRRGILRK